ncbi:hypothetical protein HMPREF9370_0913 [Neisseria wadsworthii 9715]|uniref:Uncharacterized protein n=1 Tax=Neisseria wadsworthii 9715 TaxID=1030841 RepID=G4CPA3_9NEIS|nr:hypothetical protein HMPREF9370_0913 [Neisseria wadsworthii 9715]
MPKNQLRVIYLKANQPTLLTAVAQKQHQRNAFFVKLCFSCLYNFRKNKPLISLNLGLAAIFLQNMLQ